MCSRLSIAIVLLILAFQTGCQTDAPNPKTALFQKHPELREYFTEFYQTSPEAIEDADSRVLTSNYVMLHNLRAGYTKYPDLMAATTNVESKLQVEKQSWHEFTQQIKKDMVPDSDALFYFRHCETNCVFGYLIVRRGDIYKKYYLEGP